MYSEIRIKNFQMKGEPNYLLVVVMPGLIHRVIFRKVMFMVHIYFWLFDKVNEVTHREVLTCRECFRVMNVVFVDDIKFIMSPEFNSKGGIINFLGRYPVYGRPGVSEMGYFDIQCSMGCHYKYSEHYDNPKWFFEIENVLREIDYYRSGAHNRELSSINAETVIEGQIELF